MGYRLNRLDEPVFIAVSKLLQCLLSLVFIIDWRVVVSDLTCYFSDARDGMLPDASLVQGRLLVAAWEEGLEGAGHTDPEVTNLILMAAERQLRTIITALLMDRKGFKLMDSKFPCQVKVTPFPFRIIIATSQWQRARPNLSSGHQVLKDFGAVIMY